MLTRMFATRPEAGAVAPRTVVSISDPGITPTADVWNSSRGLGSQPRDKRPGPEMEYGVPPRAVRVTSPVNTRIATLGAVSRYGDFKMGGGPVPAITHHDESGRSSCHIVVVESRIWRRAT